MDGPHNQRRLPIGAEVIPGVGVHFRVYAGPHRSVTVVLKGLDRPGEIPLTSEDNGYFSALVPGLGPGALYGYRLGGEEQPLPDPASRFQPDGPDGPSQVVDPAAFRWSDAAWPGVTAAGQVIYELHLGTFTPQGSFAAAAAELPYLKDTGITLIELMPVADFPGRFGWGYDGVNLFAPCRLYGTPDEFRRFVDLAHQLGLGIILDVVYNHLGPMGNYLSRFNPAYFTKRYRTDWGEALNFDGPDAGPTRELYIANAGYWIDEFHLDGLRLDATQNIYDSGSFGTPIVAAIGARARQAAGRRGVLLVAENEPQDTRLVRPVDRDGCGLDAVWNDDFHHTALVALTGRTEAYYTDYRGRPQEFISCAKWGYLYQGQRYAWQEQRRGTPSMGLPPTCFVSFLENHDQVANSGTGAHCHQLTSPGKLRALTALLLLGPWTPLLFQGQEYAASNPFLYFADHQDGLRQAVHQGRRGFLAQFRSLGVAEMQAAVPDPGDEATFRRCILDPAERGRRPEIHALHRDLIQLRRTDPVLRVIERSRGHVDGAVLGPAAFLLRYFGASTADPEAEDRLILCNLGPDLRLAPAPEPLLAPPAQRRWRVAWSSEHPGYGGIGAAEVETDAGFLIPAESLVLLQPAARESCRGGGVPAGIPSGAPRDEELEPAGGEGPSDEG